MATNNFHTANAQSTYVIDYGDDEHMWLESQEHLGEWVKELDPNFEIHSSMESKEELRSYPTSSIGFWDFEITYLNITFTLRVVLFLRSGYYEAANLDYEYEWFIDGSDYYEDVDSIITEISYDPTTYDIRLGLWAIHKTNLDSKLVNLQSDSINHIEALLKKVSTPYDVVAQFSNGETIYQERTTNETTS